ncbi:hypothetical protein OPV22_011451 [Ensete ventricosum]|uniref:Uncharacterized protein n=1 Tax=Ensete ventricosum TaxID=4639 RepID=A0AAV8RFC4_ENSVE|nr:hypothetical protein OPV22_011451 [Ensete ventricosum]
MSGREPKGKKASDTEVISWKQKKDLADMEETAVGKQLEELTAWTAMIEAMSDDEQLKHYVLNRPERLRSVKTGKNAPGKKVHSHSDQALQRSNVRIRGLWPRSGNITKKTMMKHLYRSYVYMQQEEGEDVGWSPPSPATNPVKHHIPTEVPSPRGRN